MDFRRPVSHDPALFSRPVKVGGKESMERSLILERANGIELAILANHIPFEAERAGAALIRIARGQLPVRSVADLQRFLNSEGIRDYEGRELAGGRFDVYTIYSLFRYLHLRQSDFNATRAERRQAAETLLRLRTVIYPLIYDRNPSEGLLASVSRFYRDCGFRNGGELQSFLGREGYRDFGNQPIPQIGEMGRRTLFALLSFAGDFRPDETPAIVADALRSAPRMPRIGAPQLSPGTALAHIPYPIPDYHFTPRSGNWGYNRGSFGTISRRGYLHPAIDLFAPLGARLVSPVEGTVVEVTSARDTRIGGNTVTIRDRSGTYYYFAHLDEVSVRQGDPVSAGTQIGRVGQTGSAEGTTPHCHFEIYRLRGRQRIHYNPDDVFMRPGQPLNPSLIARKSIPRRSKAT
ncbi:MAG: M23 family metallopeptidase, partial [Candidatus Micrarchaeota archaeon]